MIAEAHEQIHRSLDQRSTDELLDIWQKNDRQVWSSEAMQSVGEILRERQVALPTQQVVSGESCKAMEEEPIWEGEQYVSDTETPITPPPVEPYAWYKAWIFAYAHPSIGTFVEMLQDRRVSVWRAYLWVAVASLVINSFRISVHLGELLSLSAGDPSGPVPMVLGVTYALLRAAFRELLTLTVLAGVAYLVARVLRGTGSYASLVYAFAAIFAPLILITGLLDLLPIDWGVRVTYIYVVSLFVLAMRAVYGFGIGQASLAVFVSIILTILVYSRIIVRLL